MASELEARKLIIKNLQDHPQWTYGKIAREVKIDRKTVYNVIKWFKEDLTLIWKEGSGRKKGFRNPKKAKKIVALFRKNSGLSTRKVAQKIGCSNLFVQKVKKEAGLKTFKVQKVPDRNAVKNKEAKKRANKLKNDFSTKFDCCVMDDETYVLAEFL